MHRSLLHVLAFTLASCDAGPDVDSEAPPADVSQARPEGVEAISLLGEELRAPDLPADVESRYEENLAAARRAWQATPENADSIIWLGRRTAYLGRYREAIRIYSEGIEEHPEDARLYRHRGHRYITVREFDRAIADLNRAARLVDGTEDQVEPDGLPNARGVPTSTLHFNIWYHLGLAYYLAGDLESALTAWQACMGVSRHVDSRVATAYWLNNTMRRLGMNDRADELLTWVDEDLDVIESTAYLDVLLLHKGERTPQDLLGPSGQEATLESTTAGYGVAVWHRVNGRADEAVALMERVLTNRDQWAAFGYIASEADLARGDL
ncbi:MAG: hypothetical protein P8188_16270 [Gemmatimonadota bacterium]